MKRQLTLLILLFGLSTSLYGQTIVIDEMHIAPSCISAKWSNIALSDLPQNQHFCLRTKVMIDPSTLRQPTALSLAMLGSSNVYWDGKLIGSNGTLGRDRHTEKPGMISALLVIPPDLLDLGSHQLMIEASTFHIDEQMRSIFYFLGIVDYGSAQTFPLRDAGVAVFFMAALLVSGLLFQLFFWLYQPQPSSQMFSCLCLSSALLLLAEKWRGMFGYTYDWHLLRLHTIMLLTTISCLLLPGFYLVYYRIKHSQLWLALSGSLFVLQLVLVSGYDNKSEALFCTALLITLVINLLASAQKKATSWPNTLIIIGVLAVFFASPDAFLQDRFAITSFAIIVVMLSSLMAEMNSNRAQSLATVRLEAELLKRNLQPHFLMNSLMLVIEWIEEQPDAAAHFVQALAEELRILVKFSDQSTVTLAEEIQLCHRHIEIMAYRYQANYTLSVTGSPQDIIIPPAILHTQIENVFTHNHLAADATFNLTINHQGRDIELILVSSYQPNPNSNHSVTGSGIGERYIRSRLTAQFGQHYNYHSHAEGAQWINTLKFRTD